MPELGELIGTLAERAISNQKVGYGSPESRSAALIMRALDDLIMAAMADETRSPQINRVIDQLKEIFGPAAKKEKKPPTSTPNDEPEEEEEEEKEEKEEGEEDG